MEKISLFILKRSLVDRTDITLCLMLMSNSRTPYQELASKLGLSINAVHKRIKALIDTGIIRAFTARPSLAYLKAIMVWVYGRSNSAHPGEVHLRLGNNDSTYWVANSGGGYVYAGGHLRDISQLDPFVTFVKKEAEIGEPTVGIIPIPASFFPDETLRPIDYKILASLCKNSRKPVTEVASEVRASTKTIHRRLERMIERQLVDLSIDWYPDASNDIVSICHINVAQNATRSGVLTSLKHGFFQNILVEIMFGNLPNQLTLFLWTNSMREMDELRERIGQEKGVESVTVNVLQIGYMLDTWRDKLILERGEEHVLTDD